MLAVNALKQFESGSLQQDIAKQQADAIIKQLRENAAKQSAIITASALFILAGVLATQSLWPFVGLSTAIGLLFWFKSRQP
jgi:hypothetical protein